MSGRFGNRGPRGSAAAVAVLLLAAALGATPAAALPGQGPGQGEGEGARHELKERRVVVLSADGEGEAPQMLGAVLGGGYLGVELTPLTPELRAHFGVPADRGVMVGRVAKDSPAARAGLLVGDVITEVNGDAVEGSWDLGAAIRAHEAGEEADLVAWRDGRALEFRVTIEERERKMIDVGEMFKIAPGETPRVFQWKHDGEAPSLYLEPESMERLGEALEKMDWSLLPRMAPEGLAARNRELEERLQELEERLQELEEALRGSER